MILVSCAFLKGTGLYIDDNIGSDLNNGTFSSPFRTIQKAVNIMMTNTTLSTCFIYPGTYSETVEISSNKSPGYLTVMALTNSRRPVLTGSGTSNHGFYINNTGKVVIQRLDIKRFSSYGIQITGTSQSNYLIRNIIFSNATYAIYLDSENSDNNYILTNEVFGLNQNRCIRILAGDNNLFQSNYIHHSQFGGIEFSASATGNTLIKNAIFSNTTHNVYISDETADNNYIISNHIWGPGGTPNNGIYIWKGDYTFVKANRIHDINEHGIHIYGDCSNNQIIHNIVFSNINNGIFLRDEPGGNPHNNYILSNYTWGLNQDNGIHLTNCYNNSIWSNQCFYHQYIGIRLSANSTGNWIILNNCYENDSQGIFISSDNSDNNYILSNNVWGPVRQDDGIRVDDADNNIIRDNLIFKNIYVGIQLRQVATNNWIAHNEIYSNNQCGVYFWFGGSDRNKIMTNVIWGENQTDGIRIFQSDDVKVYRNLLYKNELNGIRITGNSANVEIINNTIYGSVSSNGIEWDDSSSGVMYNNILLSNTRYGIQRYSSASVTAGYNDFYGNTLGITNGGIIFGNGNTVGDPMLDTTTSYTILSPLGASVDKATNILGVSSVFSGGGPDIGYKESPFTFIPGGNDGPFFVDNDIGSDLNNGSFTNPFLTIQKAADRMTGGVTVSSCYIYPGSYPQKVSILSNLNAGLMVFTALTDTRAPFINGSLLSNRGFFISNASRILIEKLTITRYTQGVVITGNSPNNYIIRNTIYSNRDKGIFLLGENTDNNYILTNNLWGTNQNEAIAIEDGDNNVIRSNYLHRNKTYGVRLYYSVTNNRIEENCIFSNYWNGIRIINNNADRNYILRNQIGGTNQDWGIHIRDGDGNVIKDNIIRHNQSRGINFDYTAESNFIIGNLICSNSGVGIYFLTNGNYNVILSNEIRGMNQANGMSIVHADHCLIARNLFRKNVNYGITVNGSSNVKIFNNTIFGSVTDDGVLWQNTANGTMFNNILLSNGNGPGGDYGIEHTGTGLVLVDYNCFSGNGMGPTNGNLLIGVNNIFTDPLIETTGSFGISSSNSPVINSGIVIPGVSDIYNGSGPDMGWKEFSEAVPGTGFVFESLPDDFGVFPNHLNLSSGEISRIVCGRDCTVEIRIYNMAGHLIQSWDKTQYNQGDYVEWDGTYKNTGNKVGCGVYIVWIKGDNMDRKLKMIITK